MSTDVTSSQKTSTTTPPPSAQEQALLSQITGGVRSATQNLQFNNAYLLGTLGLPFDSTPYANLTRQDLGLPQSQFYDQQNPNARDILLAPYYQQLGLQPGQLPNGSFTDPNSPYYAANLQDQSNIGDPNKIAQALSEVQQENQARQQYIGQQQQFYNQVQQTPLAQLTQSQIAQAQALLPIQQAAQMAQSKQDLQQSQLAQAYQTQIAPIELQQSQLAAQLGEQYQSQVAPIKLQQAKLAAQTGLGQQQVLSPLSTQGLTQNLAQALGTSAQAYGNQNSLANNVSNLVMNGGVASPQQQALINQVYQNQLDAARQQATTDLGLATQFTTDQVAGRRGLVGTPLADSFGQLQKQYASNLGQLNNTLSAGAAQASLEYPLQLGNLGLQQQYLSGSQLNQLPQAIQTGIAATSNTPQYFANTSQYFPGYQSEAALLGGAQGTQSGYAPFQMPLGLQGTVLSGNQAAVQGENPFMVSRLSNTQGMSNGFSSTGGVIPALGAVGGLMGASGSMLSGFGKLQGGGGGG